MSLTTTTLPGPVQDRQEAVTTWEPPHTNWTELRGQDTGEVAAGIVKNTTRIPAASGKAAFRIPDELNSTNLGEVKNVARLSYNAQLRDFAAHALNERLTFTLYTRASTALTRTLRAEIDAGRIIHDTTRLGP